MRKRLRELSLSNPLVVGISLICFVMLFRLLDIFIFRLDEILGEIILSKTIGFIIVVLFVKSIGNKISDFFVAKKLRSLPNGYMIRHLVGQPE